MAIKLKGGDQIRGISAGWRVGDLTLTLVVGTDCLLKVAGVGGQQCARTRAPLRWILFV